MHGVAVLVMLAVAVGFFWPVITRTEMYATLGNSQTVHYPWAAAGDPFDQVVQSDQAHLSHPWQVALTEALRDEATLPTWNSSSWAGGGPLYANGSSGQLYPPRLLLAATVSPVTAHEILSFLHLFLAGLCAYALARELRMGWWGGLAAGLTWMCSGWVMAWLQLEVVTPTFVFLPLLIALVHRTVMRSGTLVLATTSAAAAVYLVSGHVLFELVTMLVAFGYGAALVVGQGRTSRRAAAHSAGRLAVAGVTALGLAAVVLVPTALALGQSPRATLTYDEVLEQRLADPSELVRLVWPADVPLSAEEIHFQPFVGLLATGLAAVGFVRRRRPGVGLGRTLVVVGLLATMSTPLLWAIYRLPGLGVFRPPARYSLWATMGLVILVAHGTDRCAAGLGRWWAGRPERFAPGRAALVVGGAVAIVLALNTAQLLAWGWRVNEPTFWPRESAYALPVTPAIEALRSAHTESGWPERVVPVTRAEPGDGFYPEVLGRELGTALGIESASGYDSTLPRRTLELSRILGGMSVDDAIAGPGLMGAFAPRFTSSNLRFDLLDRLGISLAYLSPFLPVDDPSWGGPTREDRLGEVVYEGPDGTIVRVEGWGAGPHLVAGIEVVADDEAGLRRFVDPDFPYRDVVVMTADQAERAGVDPSGTASDGSGEVVRSRMGVASAEVEVSTTAPMWLVVPVSWDPGWSATLDGEAIDVVRGDHQRIVVRVPAGTSTVELRYRPPGLAAGLVVSMLTTALMISWLGYVAWRRHHPRAAISVG